MNELKIGDSLWHPCNMDIIEHKITSIRQYEGFTHYVTKAVHSVGACGKVEVILDGRKDNLWFVELLHEDELEHASGLQDFIEGVYYSDKRKAELDFYRQQEVLTWANMDQKKRWYEEAKIRHEQVALIVKKIIETLKADKNEE